MTGADGDRVTCEVTKNGFRCIKFPGHPGRCRFMRVYTERVRTVDREDQR